MRARDATVVEVVNDVDWRLDVPVGRGDRLCLTSLSAAWKRQALGLGAVALPSMNQM